MGTPHKRIKSNFLFYAQKSFKVLLCLVLTMTLFFDTTTISFASQVLGLKGSAAAQSEGSASEGARGASEPVSDKTSSQTPAAPETLVPQVPPAAPLVNSPLVNSPQGSADSIPSSDQSPDSTPTPDPAPAPAVKALNGTVDVFVAFDAEPVPVTLQLQSKTRTWNAASETWGDWDDAWSDATGIKNSRITLDAATIKAHAALTAAPKVETTATVNEETTLNLGVADEASTAEPTPVYTFKEVPVQTITAPAQGETATYEKQMCYRVMESSIDGGAVVYEETFNETDHARHGTVAAHDTASKTAYTVKLFDEAALTPAAMSDQSDIAALAVGVKVENTVVRAKEEAAPEQTAPAPAPESAAPLAPLAGLRKVPLIEYPYRATVQNTSFNINNDQGDYTYRLTGLAVGAGQEYAVTVYNADETVKTAKKPLVESDTIAVPSNGKFIIETNVASHPITVTLSSSPAPADASCMPSSKVATVTPAAPSSGVKTTFVVQRPAAQKTLVKNWNDNNNALGKRPTAT
ncbi:MAG: hypothetical protein RR241_00455, partial [Raoultibacter sp.]